MRLPAFILVFLILAGCSTSAQTISYDEFADLPRDEQVRVFDEISPENRAALARTQAEHWLAIYRDQLNPEEVAVAEDVIEQIVPELYEDTRPPGLAEAMESRVMSELPLEFARLAFAEPGTTPPPPISQRD